MTEENQLLDDLVNKNLKKMRKPFDKTGIIPTKEASFDMTMAASYRSIKKYRKLKEKKYND